MADGGLTGPPAYPVSQPSQFPPPLQVGSGTGPTYASWGRRLGGYLIDFLIFAVVLLVLFQPFLHSHALLIHMMARHGQRHRTFSAMPILMMAILSLAYSTILCGGRRGQTVGMMAVNVRAVRDGTLERLGYGRALGRALVEQVFRALSAVSVLLGVVWIVDMLFPLWDAKNQTLHDKSAGSVVLLTREAG